jgi:hypothetical protein
MQKISDSQLAEVRKVNLITSLVQNFFSCEQLHWILKYKLDNLKTFVTLQLIWYASFKWMDIRSDGYIVKVLY